MSESNRSHRSFRLPWRSTASIRRDLEDEMALHIDLRARELEAGGMAPDDARREAWREFGDVRETRRYCERLDRAAEREVRAGEWLRDARQDLAIAVRGMRRNPAFTAVAVITLALGIGANAAVFTVLDAVLLRKLPFPEADRVVTVYEQQPRTGRTHTDVSAAEYLAWRDGQHAFTGIAAYGYGGFIYADGRVPEVIEGRRVTANFFDVLGVRAALGRTFLPGEDATANHIVVLTHGLWQRLFGGDSTIVGRQIRLSDTPYTVIGVLPPTFEFPGESPAIFRPIDFASALANPQRAWGFHFLRHAFARLKPGATIESARADLTTIAQRLEREHPKSNTGHLVTIEPLEQSLVREVRPTILALMGAAGFVLLIACANVANLALARALGRRREIGVRIALGAGRGRIVRQSLTESLALATIGGALGVAIAWWGPRVLLAMYPEALPANVHVAVDGSVLLFAVVVATLTGVVFGLVPALASARHDVAASLRDGARGAAGGRRASRVRGTLAVLQMAFAMVLLVGAGLLVRTLGELQRLDLGFSPERVSWVWVPLAGPKYQENEPITAFWDRLLDRLRQTPGIESVSIESSLPLLGGSGASLAIEGRPVDGPLPGVRYGSVSEGFLETLRIPLKEGRNFSPDDRPGTEPVVLINEATAKRFWPDGGAVGARVRLGPDTTEAWNRVVGVIGSHRQESLEEEPPPLALTLYRQNVWGSMTLAVRSSLSVARLDTVVAAAVHELDPGIPLEQVQTLSSVLRSASAQRRFALWLLGGFAAVALALAVVGVYGVIAYGVEARRREFGVRIALGAVPSDVVRLVVRSGAGLAVIGVVVGAVMAVPLTRTLSGLLFGVKALDAPTFVGMAVVLVAAAAVACLLPASRAAREDPSGALRAE